MENTQAVIMKTYSGLEQKGKVTWHELNLDNQLKQLHLLLHKQFQGQKDIDDNDDDDDDDSDDDASLLPDSEQIDIREDIAAAEPFPDSITIETVKHITVVDTGGQPEYIHLLPALNSYPTITFIVHDLTKKLHDPVQRRYEKEGCKKVPVQTLNYSNLDMIHLLMCFVSDSLKQPSKQIPYISTPSESYIGVVGTHYDKAKNDQRSVQEMDTELAKIFEERSVAAVHVIPTSSDEYSIIHPVDNTTAGSKNEDPQAEQIRQKIEYKFRKVPANPLPITWMILQLHLKKLHITHHTKYINYEKYKEMAKVVVSMHNKKEIETSLTYFHFIGALQYFEDPRYIFIDVQWLYNNLAQVMHISSESITFHNKEYQQKFNKQRLLADHSDCEIQLKYINTDTSISEDDLKYFFSLLIRLKIAARVTINNIEYYYLPCILSNLTMCDDKHKHLLSEPLLIQFESGFLPRGFFCSLVVHLLNKSPKNWEHQLDKNNQNFSDLMIFSLPDRSFLYMHDKIFYLKVEVRHGKRNFNAWHHSKIFAELRPYLTAVCDHLHFDEEELQFGFFCLADSCLVDESICDHIAVVGGLSEILKSMPIKLACSKKCNCETELDESHNMWFIKVSFI